MKVDLRPPSAEPQEPILARTRDTVDILHRLEGALFVSCACGMKIKVPPGYPAPTIACPICARVIAIPAAAPATASGTPGTSTATESPPAPAGPATFHFTPGHWQSFRCACGAAIQLSPNLKARKVHCPKCDAETEIISS
jgi:heat shock protein HtpX